MALTASTDYEIQRNDLVDAALRLALKSSSDESFSSAELTDAIETLNIMLKAWQNIGLNLWTVRRGSITPVASQQTYTLGPGGSDITDRPTRILKAYRRDTSDVVDTELIKLPRVDYYDLSDKDSEGTPVNFYYDPQLTNGIMYVWPTADSTFASNNTIEVIYTKPFDDMDVSSTDSFDFPQEWYEAVKYGLALRLAEEFGVSGAEFMRLKSHADEILELAKSFDVENDSLFIQPAYS